jgi:hypothetical protein
MLQGNEKNNLVEVQVGGYVLSKCRWVDSSVYAIRREKVKP